MQHIHSIQEAMQAVIQFILRDHSETHESKENIVHGTELLNELERYSAKGETEKLSQHLMGGKNEYTLADLELFLHFYAYSESVRAEKNLEGNNLEKLKKNIDHVKMAFEISNEIKKLKV